MDERINKPRVFLSHSKKNSDFIERLDVDLRKCQIDTWLDTVEIRPGKSWQDSIFEYGIPSCDAIIVYITDQSIQSSVVKKEMDVGLLQNLQDSNVAFLPYVSDQKLRGKLRPDIQALQVPEWNDKNYQLLLPRVVAEIWRSYLERIIGYAVNNERLKRTQLELELERKNNQNNTVFSSSEEAEFNFITRQFSKEIKVTLLVPKVSHIKESEDTTYNYVVDLLSVVTTLPTGRENSYSYYRLLERLESVSLEVIRSTSNKKMSVMAKAELRGFPDIFEELRMYGLVEALPLPVSETQMAYGDRVYYENVFTNKMFRYRYWLAFNRKLPEEISIAIE